MLTDAQRALIKSTVPLLETGGEALITHFYQRLFTEHPEVRPMFNPDHQASGAQPRALALAVLMYARNIDQLEKLEGAVKRISHKHVTVRVRPEHYPLVGACLLRSMREVLGSQVATDEVVAAWGAAYQQLADLFIASEASLYAAQART